jgi:hypothetical protein
MASSASEAAGSPVFLREGWLMMRAAGGWHKRYFLLDARGLLFFNRSREAAVAACVTRRAATAEPAGPPAVPEEETSAGDVPPEEVRPLYACRRRRPCLTLLTAQARADDEEEDELEADAAALARAVGSVWTMGSSLLRGAVSGARSLAETAGELASAGAARVAAPAGGSLTLLTCSIKLGPPEGDAALRQLPFVFRCLSPTAGASLTLQAESAAERASWVGALQGANAEILAGAGRRTGGPALLLRAVAGNDACADCAAAEPVRLPVQIRRGADAPHVAPQDWASLNLGVLLCQRCAGAHRRLGVAASAVRSLTLDEDAWTPTVLALFAARGNDRSNALWAAGEAEGRALSPDAPMEARLELARAKYVDRLYMDAGLVEAAAAPGALAAAAAAGDLERALALLAAGAATQGALEASARAGSLLLAQALLLAGADALSLGAPLEDLVPPAAADAAALRSLLLAGLRRQQEGRSLSAAKADDGAPSVDSSRSPTERSAADKPRSPVPSTDDAAPSPQPPDAAPRAAQLQPAAEPPFVAVAAVVAPSPPVESAVAPLPEVEDEDDEWLDS